MRLNPRVLTRPERKVQTRTFTDPAQPGSPLTLTLRALNFPELARLGEEVAPIVEMWCGERGQQAGGFPVPGGEPVPLTEGLVQTLSTLSAMQVPEGGEEPYTWDELLILSVMMPAAFPKVLQWVNEVQDGSPGGVDPNSPGGPGALSSSPPSATGASTSTLPNDATTSSGASTNGSGPSAGDSTPSQPVLTSSG